MGAPVGDPPAAVRAGAVSPPPEPAGKASRPVLTRFGVDFTFADTSDPAAVEAVLRGEPWPIFIETPANPTLDLPDVAAVSEAARARGILHIVDNTLLTPWLQRPFALGADLAVHSCSMRMSSHGCGPAAAIRAQRRHLYWGGGRNGAGRRERSGEAHSA